MAGQSETLSPALPAPVEQLALDVLNLATQNDLMIATAESCTGGLLASLLTDVEGCGHCFDRGFDCGKLPAKFFSPGEQYTSDLAFLFAFQVLNFIISFDRIKRLDKNRLAARRKSVGHAADLTAEIRFNGNYEPIVSDRYKLVLNRLTPASHYAFE